MSTVSDTEIISAWENADAIPGHNRNNVRQDRNDRAMVRDQFENPASTFGWTVDSEGQAWSLKSLEKKAR